MNFLSGIGSLGTQITKQTKPTLAGIAGTAIGLFSSIFGKKEAPSSPTPMPIYPVQPEKTDSTFLYIALGGIFLFGLIFLSRRRR